MASQTIENMAAIEAVTSMPVLRPLIGHDKQEIINIARMAGSFELSILPHFDCCSFLLPENPATKCFADELDSAEEELDVDSLVADALKRTEVHRIKDAVAWEEIPIPEEAAE